MDKLQIYILRGYQGWRRYAKCRFNPTKLSLTKTIKLTKEASANSNVGTVTFGGGNPASIKLDLFFDTTDTGRDVREQTGPVAGLAEIMDIPNKPIQVPETRSRQVSYQEWEVERYRRRGRRRWRQNLVTRYRTEHYTVMVTRSVPPTRTIAKCKFVWGRTASFVGYVKSVKQEFLLFLRDGTPVRAKLKVTLEQVDDGALFPRQNPTSFSAPRKMWVVEQGERLDFIAYQEYGDSKLWRHIAETNNISDPMDLRPGQVLNIVPFSG